ncbi:hypothetical protein H310_12935 [Aphanomyces invadans]|uniref:Uncharacterized protein n=1 Tax=Aphanomyces invadans TaxID=157072 RepID=A0A024TFM0_9STRA|nr:hypothetical protein H310_12935 [Aphanomyces invadans]ETV92930.1 hypothetical protein H310_12935 [Aphanomyces invadans]|eukprot:XP_008878451.1 hypothetical protein H310_12935 [Aphanomyces invadans]
MVAAAATATAAIEYTTGIADDGTVVVGARVVGFFVVGSSVGSSVGKGASVVMTSVVGTEVLVLLATFVGRGVVTLVVVLAVVVVGVLVVISSSSSGAVEVGVVAVVAAGVVVGRSPIAWTFATTHPLKSSWSNVLSGTFHHSQLAVIVNP